MELQTTLVDLDNISFFKGASRVDVLKLRLRTIHSMASPTHSIHWFFNEDTEAMLKRERIVLKGTRHVSVSRKDAADFEIINHAFNNTPYMKGSSTFLTTIITADRSIVRLAFYIYCKAGQRMRSLRLQFASFRKGISLEIETPLQSLFNFRSAHDLGKFAAFLSSYHTIYPEIPSPVRARTISLAVSKP